MAGKNLGKEIKFFLVKNLLAYPIFYFLNAYSHTLRFRVDNAEEFIVYLAGGGKIVFSSWHQRFFGGFYLPYLLNLRIAIMISQSRDGDFVSDAVSKIGWRPVRGSSSRGGRKALMKLVEMMRRSPLGGHIVDGPNGPPEIIKPGLISLAQQSGAAILPVYVSYEKPIIFKSWDRFMIPKPFSRVLVRMGAISRVPEELDAEGFERCRSDLEKEMRAGYQDADGFWNGNEKSRFSFLAVNRKKIRAGRKAVK